MLEFYAGRREARRFSELVYGPVDPRLNRYVPTKVNARAVATACGVRIPQLYAQFNSPDHIDFTALPERFALKPDNLASKRGVFLLTRTADGLYDAFSRRVWQEDEIRKSIADVVARFGRQPLVLAEELVAGENGATEIPYDYKMYTFDGVVELVVQVNRNTKPAQLAFFGHGFSPLERHCVFLSNGVRSGEPKRPRNWEQMLDVARRISLHLDQPFVSVDCYTTGTDTVLGELTPKPGGPYHGMFRFSNELDAELGTYWRLGLRRRGIEPPIVEALPPVLEKAIEAAELEQTTPRSQLSTYSTRGWAAANPPGIRKSARYLAAAIRRRVWPKS